ncbi:hypothetical protein MKX03_027328 [Papaver bracteatum]|nr:hypothetical protein MKX03_027328 [Papaver bracteatum]
MERMVCSSSKPHFFQPILPGSSSAHARIPKAFQTDYLVDGEDSEGVATLMSTPLKKSWKVKLNDFKFTDGWEDFLKAHDLVEYSTEPLMSEGGVKHETHCCEAGAEGRDRAKSTDIGKGKGKSKFKGKTLNSDFVAFFFVCAERCNT